ncbi:MAG: hypothetical protein Q9159_002859 [Coniocarpon cinnabarinum]
MSGQPNGVPHVNGASQPNGVSPPARATEAAYPLEELSWKITKDAGVVSHYLAANNLPQPSFNADGPSTILGSTAPQGIQQARQNLIASSLELFQLAIGPTEFLPNLALGFQYISCLHWLCQYHIFHLVPLSSGITYAELSAKAQVPEQRLRSILRMAMTNALFRESPDNKQVLHTATSALLARDENVYAYATYMCARSAPMALEMAAANKKWGADTESTHQTAYNIANNTDLTFFDHLSRDEDRTAEFARYMKNVRSSEAVDIKHLVAGFDWQTLPAGGTVVDVGGSTGTSSQALARAHSSLNFIVQDLPPNADAGRKALPSEFANRITFQGHDFMDPQPVHAADAYLLRMILHDWPDAESAKILSNIVAQMDAKKSRLLIMDTVLPKPGSVPVSEERIVRVRDLTMMQAFNSKERDIEDWERLLGMVDSRLRIVGVKQPFGSAMGVLEIVLQ